MEMKNEFSTRLKAYDITPEQWTIINCLFLMPPSREREEKTGSVAAEIMTSPPITAHGNTPLTELSQVMAEEKISRVVIVDKEMHPLGIVSQIDIVKYHGAGLKFHPKT